LLDRIAGLYESMAIDSFDIDGFAIEIPSEGSVKLASLKLRDFANWRIAEYAIEGLDIRVPGKDPVQIGRAAVLGLKVADLLRWAKNATKGAMTPEHSVGMLKLLEGVSINKVTVPMKPGQKPVVIDVFDLSWGQYVGLLPSKARMTLKLSGPIDTGSGNEFARYLVQSGITSVTANLDVGAGWTEASHTFVVTPLSLDVTDWFSANASVSLGDVTREIFTLDPTILSTQAMGLEVGIIEITVRDSGAIDRFLAQLAKDRNLSPDDARRSLLIDMDQAAQPLLSANPELRSVFSTAVKFMETSKGTFSVKVIPNGKIQIINLIAAMQDDPFTMLSSFKIDATASR
jgi:hypothetical protein